MISRRNVGQDLSWQSVGQTCVWQVLSPGQVLAYNRDRFHPSPRKPFPIAKLMRFVVRLLIVVCLLAGLIGSIVAGREYWERRNRPEFRTVQITEGSIDSVVNSTGEVKPVVSVSVGSFVSGPIKALHVDFNDEVSEGQLMAEIDPRIYEAAVQEDRAVLAIRRGEVHRVEAELGRGDCR